MPKWTLLFYGVWATFAIGIFLEAAVLAYKGAPPASPRIERVVAPADQG